MQPVYYCGGLCQPIKADGTSQFRTGSTIPVKFQLTDPNGAYVSEATAQLEVARITAGTVGPYQPAIPTGGRDSSNAFVYSEKNNQYVFNLATKGMAAGTWSLKISLNNGDVIYGQFTLWEPAPNPWL
jgi:hypothetical protein